MNRIIKFRAYDGKKMYDWDYLKQFTSVWLDSDDREGSFIPMQFTGLLDKNGKEVYEGDVLAEYETVMSDHGENLPGYIDVRVDPHFEYADGRIGERRYGKKIYVVEWTDESCGFEPFSDSAENCGHCGCGRDSTVFQVIGNIYENPELLK